MASIRVKRLSNGKAAYLVRFRASDGTERTKQFARRREAEQYGHTVEVERATGSFVDPRLGRTTVAEWFDTWWPTVTDLRSTTKTRDEASFRNHVLPVFGSTALARVDRTALRTWVAELADPDVGGLAPATVAKAVQVFNKAMRAAHEDRLIATNPVDRLPVPRIERDEMRSLRAEEVWRLADAIDSRYRPFVLLAGFSGLRLGEMLALRWQNVDLDEGRVSVRETLTELAGHFSFGPPKTRNAVRSVSIPPFVADAVASVRPESSKPADLVFVSPLGGPVRATLFRRRVWQPAVREAGLAPLRIHDLRHTAISLWIAAGAHPKQIAVRAGHSSVSVVLDRYGHLLPEHDLHLVDALEALAQRRDHAT